MIDLIHRSLSTMNERQKKVSGSGDMNDREKSRDALIQEIEDLRRQVLELRDSEKKYRQWFEDSPISLWEQDYTEVKRRVDEIKSLDVGDLEAYFHAHPDLVRELAGLVRVVDVNKFTLQLYRAANKEEFLSGITGIFSRQSYESFIDTLMTVAEGKTRFSTERIHETCDGETIEVHLHWAVAPGYEDTCGRVLLSIVDVTRQKRSERLLERKSNERRLLLDTIPVQVWYLSDMDTYGALNRAHGDFLGRHPRDIAHRRMEEFTSPDVARISKAGNARVFEARKPVYAEEWMPNAAGEERLIAVTRTPVVNEKNEVQYVVCTGMDITSQRQTEILLRESEARFRHIFELSPVGTELYDGDGRLILINPACVDMFGIEDSAEALDFQLFDDPNLDDSLKQRLRRGEMVRYGVEFDFEKVRTHKLYRTRKEGIIHLQVVITPMTGAGEERPTGYLVLVSNVYGNHIERTEAQGK